MWSRFSVGNNSYTGRPVRRTLLQVDGDELAEVELGEHGELVVSLRLFDSRGALDTQLRRNQWGGIQNRFEYARAPRRVVVRRAVGRGVLFDVVLRPHQHEVAVVYADLYTARGWQVLVDPEFGVVVRDPHTLQRELLLANVEQHQPLSVVDIPVRSI
jgi:hypothetical protein